MGSISHYIMPLVINSLGGRHTHRHPHRNNIKKPDGHQLAAGLYLVYKWDLFALGKSNNYR